MPELPEVETVRQGLEQAIKGRELTDIRIARQDLRLPIPSNFTKTFQNHRVEHVDRRAKYLLVFFKALDAVMVWHLGMSGRVLILEGKERQQEMEPHVHVIMTFDDCVEVRFRDPRRFGLLVAVDRNQLFSHPLLAHLGPEPLGKELSLEYLSNVLEGKKAPIKSILCDQALIAGVGNIYACEALFKAGISPFRLGQSLSREEVSNLILAIQAVLRDAVQAGGASIRDHVQPNGMRGYFQELFAVYDREGERCLRCKKTNIMRKIQSGRSTFYCPTCQK
jgi:formamidopyrimidine-DNA glycosylase